MSTPSARLSTQQTRLALAGGLVVVLGVGGLVATRAARPSRGSGPTAEEFALATARPDSVQPDLCIGRNLKGTGVRMDVFASADTTQSPVQSGLVRTIDLGMTPGSPVTEGQRVRWSGWFMPHGSGNYRFELPKGVTGQLTVNNAVVIDAATGRTDNVGTPMDSTRFYPFTLIVTVDRAATDAGMWVLAWAPPETEMEPLLRGNLFPPMPVFGRPTVAAR